MKLERNNLPEAYKIRGEIIEKVVKEKILELCTIQLRLSQRAHTPQVTLMLEDNDYYI